MNDERLGQLIDAHLSGEMTEAERRELEERLLYSAADRARFWELAETHTLLHEAMQRQLAGSRRGRAPAARFAAVRLVALEFAVGGGGACSLWRQRYGSRCVGHPGSPERTQNRSWRWSARLCAGAGRTGGKCVCPRASGEAVGACRAD